MASLRPSNTGTRDRGPHVLSVQAVKLINSHKPNDDLCGEEMLHLISIPPVNQKVFCLFCFSPVVELYILTSCVHLYLCYYVKTQ